MAHAEDRDPPGDGGVAGIVTQSERRRATLIGATAVLMWAGLALLTLWAGPTPPNQLVAMAFTVAFAMAVALDGARGRRPWAAWRQPVAAWALGVGGLGGFHVLLFVALQNAPPVEASLINYTWPLLIVLFSALLPGERLRWFHLAGAGLGLAGAALLILGDAGDLGGGAALGYGAAVASALVWSSYSVLSRRFAAVPTQAVGGFCGAVAVVFWVLHLGLERFYWPTGAEALAIIGLGLGPVGLAFFTWDHGMKHGDIQALGGLAYLAPLLSTLLLLAFGIGQPTLTIGLACLLIVGGAALAGHQVFLGRRA